MSWPASSAAHRESNDNYAYAADHEGQASRLGTVAMTPKKCGRRAAKSIGADEEAEQSYSAVCPHESPVRVLTLSIGFVP